MFTVHVSYPQSTLQQQQHTHPSLQPMSTSKSSSSGSDITTTTDTSCDPQYTGKLVSLVYIKRNR